MILHNLTIAEAKQYKQQYQTCHVVLTGLTATIYTGADIEKSLRWLTPTEFRDRFTSDEMKSILMLSESDINVRLLLFKLQTVSAIGLDTEEVINGVNYLGSINAIDESRVADILI